MKFYRALALNLVIGVCLILCFLLPLSDSSPLGKGVPVQRSFLIRSSIDASAASVLKSTQSDGKGSSIASNGPNKSNAFGKEGVITSRLNNEDSTQTTSTEPFVNERRTTTTDTINQKTSTKSENMTATDDAPTTTNSVVTTTSNGALTTSAGAPTTSAGAQATTIGGPTTTNSMVTTVSIGAPTTVNITSTESENTTPENVTTSAPTTTTSAENVTTSAPTTTTSAKNITTSAPTTQTTSAEIRTTSAPTTTTSAENRTTSAPTTTTSAENKTTSAPTTTTSTENVTTSAPTTTTSAENSTTSAAENSTTSAPTTTSLENITTLPVTTSNESATTSSITTSTSTTSAMTTNSNNQMTTGNLNNKNQTLKVQIGGIVGGVVCLLVIVLVVIVCLSVYLYKRSKRNKKGGETDSEIPDSELEESLWGHQFGDGASGSSDKPLLEFSDDENGNEELPEMRSSTSGDCFDAVNVYFEKHTEYVQSGFETPRELGSRMQKHWYSLCEREDNEARKLLTACPLSQSCPLKLHKHLKGLNELLEAIKPHPYLHPIEHVDFLVEHQLLVMVQPYVPSGSLKDMIYKTQPLRNWSSKYSRRSAGLPNDKIKHYGRQILEAMKFLYSRGFPTLGHVQTGNIFVVNDVCKLGGYENTLLGYKTRLYRLCKDNLEHLDIILFGHTVFEMAAGYELTQARPGDDDYKAVVDPQVKPVLKYIFDEGFPHDINDIATTQDLFFCDASLDELHDFVPSELNNRMKKVLVKACKNKPRVQKQVKVATPKAKEGNKEGAGILAAVAKVKNMFTGSGNTVKSERRTKRNVNTKHNEPEKKPLLFEENEDDSA